MAAYYYRYRKSSGEVVGMSVEPDVFVEDYFFGVLESEEKIAFATTQIVDAGITRAASEEEIKAFSALKNDDEKTLNRDYAKTLFDTQEGSLPRSLRALISALLGEINDMRKALSLEQKTLDDLKNTINSAIDAEE